MKYLGIMVIALAAYVAADAEWSPILEKSTFVKFHDDCMKQSGITAEQNEKIIRAEYPDEKEVHNYVHCVDKKIGVFSDDKGYDVQRIMDQLEVLLGNAEELRELVTNCLDNNEQKSAPAERAYRGKVCIMKTRIGEMIKKSGKTHIL